MGELLGQTILVTQTCFHVKLRWIKNLYNLHALYKQAHFNYSSGLRQRLLKHCIIHTISLSSPRSGPQTESFSRFWQPASPLPAQSSCRWRYRRWRSLWEGWSCRWLWRIFQCCLPGIHNCCPHGCRGWNSEGRRMSRGFQGERRVYHTEPTIGEIWRFLRMSTSLTHSTTPPDAITISNCTDQTISYQTKPFQTRHT